MILERYIDFIDTYSGRDKLMRLLYYCTQYGAGVVTSKTLSKKLNVFGEQLYNCRAVLRLFDDMPMLSYTLSYGWGHKEQDKLMQFCGVASNALDQLYYPVEHVAWAADLKLLSLRSDPWWTTSSVCWALSTYFTIIKHQFNWISTVITLFCFIRSLRYFGILQGIKRKLKQEGANSRLAVMEISQIELNELLVTARCFLDFIHAIHWLPPGILWAGKLKQWQVGFLGILSSLLNLCQS